MSGKPVDEPETSPVADDATAAEAAQARTTGTSVEQAAVLRALGGGVGKLGGKNRRGTSASDNPNKPKS